VRASRKDIPTLEQRKCCIDFAHHNYEDHLTDFRLGGPHAEALHDLLALCRKENLPAILVLTPEGETFRSWYPPGVWEQLNSHVPSLAAEFRVPLVDAHEWIHEEDFSDSHHLLMSGVNKYTARLGQEGILPVLTTMGLVKSDLASRERQRPEPSGR